jgi:hypothetical protein
MKVSTYPAGLFAKEAVTIAPAMTTPWIALAPDIMGVCRVEGILLITSTPTRRLRMKMARLL